MNDSIFTPRFESSSRIQNALEDIDRQRWLVENMLLMPRHEAWMHREVRVRRAAGTTAIEGGGLSEAEVRKVLAKATPGRMSEDERANINADKAYEFIDFLSDDPEIHPDELAIRELHRYFMAGSPEVLTPGTYRKGRNKIGDFVPPDQGDVPSLMRSFALWLRESDPQTHPIVKAGIAHIHLVAIHPFWDGNGRTARGLSTLMLQRSPFAFRKLLAVESYLYAIRDDYLDAIRQTLGGRFSLDYDATGWLEFFVVALKVNVDGLTGSLTDWHRMMQESHADGAAAGLVPRQVDGLMFAIRSGQITRSAYAEIADVSPATSSRDLAQLVRKGFLTQAGNTRARVYYPVVSQSEGRTEPPGEQIPLLSDHTG